MKPVTLFACGDVMLGRGIDQILPHPCSPDLYEPYVTDARDYVELARRAHGSVSTPVSFDYVWGDALEELARASPDVRLVNLETSITRSPEPWLGKGIHYRMSPENARALASAHIDICGLANNHVLDWGRAGLAETLRTLARLGIRYCGAGEDAQAAEAPATIDLGEDGRVLVFAVGVDDSGIPASWSAGPGVPGIARVPDLSGASLRRLTTRVERHARPGDLVVVSIHWGPNWGNSIPRKQRHFAHALIDHGVHFVHGHSSHHVKAIEVHRGGLILYGCGDLLSDYEGIRGYEEFRGDLGLMYFPRFAAESGLLVGLTMTPTRLHHLRINRATRGEASWLREHLNEVSEPLETGAELDDAGRLELRWS